MLLFDILFDIVPIAFWHSTSMLCSCLTYIMVFYLTCSLPYIQF